ncbi:FAD:protein FMN transferase [Ideonella sp. A 288]|uniref:FAD:protein FMN transferase n=1 Tax=Ideonella sp. A 288 TaxID=1962181 RepID=UPI000B4A7FBB|nr:FAD:protein FMN transferase [Ideonella sp. A 288]
MALHTELFAAMGTACEIRLDAPSAAQAADLAARAIADVRRLEARYSRYRDDSDLSAINRVAAAGGTCEVDAETAALLDYAQTCHRQSDGLFDISSGILRRAWRFASGELPDPAQVAQLREHVGWHRLRWQAQRLAFPEPGMELDFGGIVKEYAVDRAAAQLAAAGVRHGFINLGGDVRAIGPQADGSPWRIGIRHPREPGALLTTLELGSGALASSGDYERCIVIDGVRHGHILNPRTGWPVRTLAAVSVVAPLCVVAGSAATIAMLKEGDGAAWLGEMGLPCLWVTVDGACGGSLLDAPGAR